MTTLHVLSDIVSRVSYRDGWSFTLDLDLDRGQDSRGPTLVINVRGPDSYDPTKTIRVNHYMIVPEASYNERSWRRWLFEQCVLVERHECMEHFKIDGHRPYAPNHSEGNDPYAVCEVVSVEEARLDHMNRDNPEREV